MERKRFLLIFIVVMAIGICNPAHAKIFGKSHPKRMIPTASKIHKTDTISDYMKDMERRIKSNWAPPQNSFKNKTVVNFQIYRDGTIKNSKISETSGDKEFDNGAMNALAAAKLSPLPSNILGDYIDIKFTFERVSYLVHKECYDK